MKIKLVGKNIEITEGLREAVDKKLCKLDKYFKEEVAATVAMEVQKGIHKVEVTIPFSGGMLRSEEANDDMYKSIDLIIDKLERQIRKQKTKLQRKLHSEFLDFGAIPEYSSQGEEESKIVRTKRFAMKPMMAEEAVLQMELLGHNFFVYMDADSSEVNVVYKRKDGHYGLIEPDLE
ncbi:putative sigma-54 modulation protein [Hathewaya proteolytica DSM 3090]|uniref:Ribosome hibernation promoting factor n=1 Tax=Hathewaya proteolytica DSM 3090 TaxID=1121331 RepID=A0A1M6LYH0_9CLOT|nr:ribosome-associated translation inhibitor RaiA [Hathewaya proteolytica]SHJ76261.1 putative sigma-54 modulation protein [Hathewaya proteolytica DSM 3090]